MPLKYLALIPMLYMTIGQADPVPIQSNIAQLMAEKALSKIISPDMRKNIRADADILKEEYDDKGKIKSRKKDHKSLNGKLEVSGMSMDYLYQALATRFEFYIDDKDSAAIVNNITCAVIKFRPKPNLRSQDTADEFINRTSGSVYISLDDFGIVKLEGSIKEQFHFTYWLLFVPLGIDVYRFEFAVEYGLFNQVLVEQRIGGLVDYEIRNRGTEKFDNTITNYRMK